MGQRDKRQRKARKVEVVWTAPFVSLQDLSSFQNCSIAFACLGTNCSLPKPPCAEAKYCQKLSGDLVEPSKAWTCCMFTWGGKRNGMNWPLLGVAWKLFVFCQPDLPFGVLVSSTAVRVWKWGGFAWLGNTFSRDIIWFLTFVLPFFSPAFLFHLNVFGKHHC